MTKTEYVNGLLCKKRYWLQENHPDWGAPSDNVHTLEGKEVGTAARELFSSSVTIPLAARSDMILRTRELIEDGVDCICEASFGAGNLFCAADIVQIGADKVTVDLFEVKSTVEEKDIQIDDIAFQCYVIEAAGYTVRSANFILINKDYMRGEELDLSQLFVVHNCTERVRARMAHVPQQIIHLDSITSEPETDIGVYCERPYTCPFKDFCFAQHGIPKQSVFNIAGLAVAKKYGLYQKGVISVQQMKENQDLFSVRQAAQVSEMLDPNQSAIYVLKDKVRQFLEMIQYPLYLLDFESFQKAIPPYRGITPYMQIPFQYSLHIKNEGSVPLQHKEFLAYPGSDPRRLLAERLVQDIPPTEQVMAYNMAFERSVIRKLADIYPDLKSGLMAINTNMVDLMVPFQKKWVTSPALHGSYSIKAVLPVLCGGDPELDYHQLPGVQNGAEASATFAMMQHMAPDEMAASRSGLLQYCGLDTLAMVKILERLHDLAQ